MTPSVQVSVPSDSQLTLQSASSLSQVQSVVADFLSREAELSRQLADLQKSKDVSFRRDIQKIDQHGSQLSAHVLHARSIGRTILTEAAETASRLSSAVRLLDQEQANVKITLDVVEQLVQLRECVLGLHEAMTVSQDWEKAAQFLHKSLSIPASVIDCEYAEQVIPTVEVPDPPRVTLQSASDSLCGLFVREFEKAVGMGDNAAVTRYFKLFPLIDRVDVGLDVYARYVCQGITARARQNLSAQPTYPNPINSGVFYVNVLTMLFEHIAQILDHHQRLVETHYGQGKLIQVAERLQSEADIQGGIIVDSWFEETGIDRRLTDLKSHSFSFSGQSVMGPTRAGPGGRNTPNDLSLRPSRSSSPAVQAGMPSAAGEEKETVNMRELELLLVQCATMLNRWSLYIHFLASKDLPPSSLGDGTGGSPGDVASLKAPGFILESNLHRKVVSNLIDPFNAMLSFFFRRSVERAFRMDEAPAGLSLRQGKPLPSPPFVGTVVDDMMFVLHQVLHRALSTSQPAIVSTVMPSISRTLTADYIGTIQQRMKNEYYPRPAMQGSLPPEDKIVGFIVQLNNLSLSIGYIRQIVRSAMAPPHDSSSPETPADTTLSGIDYLRTLFPLGRDAELVFQHLHSLETVFAPKAEHLLTEGLHVLFLQVVKPQMRPIVVEAFKNTSYDISHLPSSSGLSGNILPPSAVKMQFGKGFHSLMGPLLRLLDCGSGMSDIGPVNTAIPSSSSLNRNPQQPSGAQNAAAESPRSSTALSTRLLTLALSAVAELVEKRIWALSGRVTPLGALALERDVSAIVEEASSNMKHTTTSGGAGPGGVSGTGGAIGKAVAGGGRYAVADLFARCSQMVTVLGMDPDEWAESVKDVAGERAEDDEWVLSVEERRKVRDMLVEE